MQRYVVRRVGALAVTLFFVSLLVFVVVRVLPGDPALIILGLEANADSVARVRQALGLDQPVSVQYVRWVGQALRGDLGRSIQYDLPVGALTLSRLNVTLPLTLLAASFMIAAAIPLGVFAATRHRRWGGARCSCPRSRWGSSSSRCWRAPPAPRCSRCSGRST